MPWYAREITPKIIRIIPTTAAGFMGSPWRNIEKPSLTTQSPSRNPSSSPHQAADKGQQEEHQEQEEQDSRNADSCGGDTQESEYSGNQRDDEEDDRPTQHESSLCD